MRAKHQKTGSSEFIKEAPVRSVMILVGNHGLQPGFTAASFRQTFTAEVGDV
jgi:hypothetical protein